MNNLVLQAATSTPTVALQSKITIIESLIPMAFMFLFLIFYMLISCGRYVHLMHKHVKKHHGRKHLTNG